MPQTVIITGASKGIGLWAAEFMLADGAHVVAVQRSSTSEFAALQNKYPNALRVVLGDFTKDAIIQQAIDEAQKSFGGLDTVVLNAGINTPFGTVEKLPLADWHNMFNINVFGPVAFLRQVLPTIRKSSEARMVLVTSGAAEYGIPGMGAYSASKAAVNSINRTLAAEEPGIISVAVHPGTVKTKMFDDFSTEIQAFALPDAIKAAFASTVPIDADVSGRALAGLALRAPKELSGKYVQWNDAEVSALSKAS